MIEFTIIDAPNQRFSTILNDKNVDIHLYYSTETERWSMSLTINGILAIAGIRLVTGIDLIKNLQLDIGVLFCVTFNGEQPNRNNLVDGQVKFYQSTADELKEFLDNAQLG